MYPQAIREIKDSKLTVVGVLRPVIMTGYVTEVLSNVSMVSIVVSMVCGALMVRAIRNGLKVDDGGPYLKTKGRWRLMLEDHWNSKKNLKLMLGKSRTQKHVAGIPTSFVMI